MLATRTKHGDRHTMTTQMKSWWIRTEGNAMRLDLRDSPVPQAKAGELRIRVHAASLNRGEFVAGLGLHAAGAPARPAGFEAAGEVDQVGPGVTGFNVGDRVMGRCDASFAQWACMNVGEALPVPAALSWEQAASTSLVLGTVHDILLAQGRLQAGEWVLVAGVSSGVGVACLQVAKALGARVIGTSGSQDKLERLKPLGLDVGVATRGEGLAKAVLEATGGRGADLAVNNVGGSMFAEIVQALAFQGRMATVGYVDGVVKAQIDILALHKKRLTLYGVSNKLRSVEQRIEATRHFARDLMPLLADGSIAPLIDQVFGFGQLEAAKSYMEGGAHLGKIVLRVSEQ
ncbi:MAG: Alcohol dehydrogenase, zinc-binding protein [Ramlibacter sp.]|jgi:NADPH2:quinone reductase|nr:Alcohol dehydrogenase, zinc-binding protein [Ramlibacter sp.]